VFLFFWFVLYIFLKTTTKTCRIKLGTLLVNRCKVMNSKKCPLWLTFETVTNDNNGEIGECEDNLFFRAK
jgi:hypothetical protein